MCNVVTVVCIDGLHIHLNYLATSTDPYVSWDSTVKVLIKLLWKGNILWILQIGKMMQLEFKQYLSPNTRSSVILGI